MTREERWTIGRQLAAWRQRRGLSQEALAQVVGLSRNRLCQVERGIVTLDALVVCRIYARFGAQLQDFVPRELWK